MKRFDVPLLFVEPPKWPASADPPSIQYALRVYEPTKGGSVQPLLKDRLVLQPDIDLNRYRCRAVIDWIEVQIDTAGFHQAGNMQRLAKTLLADMGVTSGVYVSGPTRSAGYKGSSFIVRVQQPKAHSLIALCKKLILKYDPDRKTVEDLPIVGVEVSVDFYVKDHKTLGLDAQNLLRWQMTDVLRRHLKPKDILTEKESCFPRFVKSEGSTRKTVFLINRKLPPRSGTQHAEIMSLGLERSVLIPLRIGAHNRAPMDATSYMGAKDHPIMLRVMDKTTDCRDPITNKFVPLPPAERRSRLEVTVLASDGKYDGPSAIGLSTLGDLFGYQFNLLRKPVFELFLPTINERDATNYLPFPVNVTETEVFGRSGVYGLDRMHRSIEKIAAARFRRKEIACKTDRLGSKGRLISYGDLNQKIDRALRKLSKDWDTLRK